jgi:CheY-like chemotaxis protein
MSDHNRFEREKALAAAATELNNLLQIITGAVSILENGSSTGAGAEHCLRLLRASVDRAAKVTEHLAGEIGGTAQKILLHPALNGPAAKPARIDLKVAHRILVVDDEPMALELSKRTLAEAGFVITTVSSGSEAIRLLEQQPAGFDLVLLDFNLPEMDGEETFTRLRAVQPKILVLLNTGFIERHRLDRMMKNGLTGFLRRPYRPNELIAQISSILASGKRSAVRGREFGLTR